MKKLLLLLIALCIGHLSFTQNLLEPIDIFDIEYVSDPQVSPDGSQIIYTRNFKDIMTDKNLSNLWIINADGTVNRPLTTGNQNDRSARWSPDGNKIVYLSNKDGSSQIYLRWLDSGSESKLSNLQKGPSNLTWSPDGKWIAFSMFVDGKPKVLASLEGKPKGAKWNEPAIYIDDMKYRADGAGYLKQGYRHLHVISADGGTARQITSGDYNFNRGEWSPDGKHLLTSTNMHPDRETTPRNSEVHLIEIESGDITTLTDRFGPDANPQFSPDGSMIAYMGSDDNYDGYQVAELYVMNADGSEKKLLSGNHDRSINDFAWSEDGQSLFISNDNEGDIQISSITLNGNVNKMIDGAGGVSIGRPYAAGSFSVGGNDVIAFTHGGPDHPSDLGVFRNGVIKRLTQLNEDLFSIKDIGEVEEIWYESSYDGRKIQGWICKPPGFDPNKKYPLMLEIHGGPFATYGPWFSSEVQLYAAAGYVVLYTNPRGSSSYGKEFGNLIHHNYPSQDYDDLMSGVDEVIDMGYIDEDQLFVTGGSGGGVLTSWIVGKTDRFAAAVVAKPVINWYSFVLYADNPATFYKYWFPGKPWEHLEHYMKRSPISLVGNVTTPTMLLTGEEDYRTPIAESEQYYAALKLNGVESAMVRIPGASHGIAARPSNLMAKVANILAWCEKYRKKSMP
ncbi:MAG: S9 family peptidase [Saprospiraceae bacterium]|nr:S9 family peptidase [Saprospiraceae bacterium]